MWNSLPNDAVHAESTNESKTRLDKFWSNEEIIYASIIMPKFKKPLVKV